MNRLLRLCVAATVIAAALATTGGGVAHACSCSTQTDANAARAADAVFLGVAGDPERGDRGTDPTVWTFTVQTVFKGDVAARQEVITPTRTASCGLAVDAGATYLVFGTRDGDGLTSPATKGQLSAHLCNGTRVVDATGVPASLGAGDPPDAAVAAGPGVSSRTVPMAIGAAALSAAAALLWRQKRARS